MLSIYSLSSKRKEKLSETVKLRELSLVKMKKVPQLSLHWGVALEIFKTLLWIKISLLQLLMANQSLNPKSLVSRNSKRLSELQNLKFNRNKKLQSELKTSCKPIVWILKIQKRLNQPLITSQRTCYVDRRKWTEAILKLSAIRWFIYLQIPTSMEWRPIENLTARVLWALISNLIPK